jgi:hypothetical protein
LSRAFFERRRAAHHQLVAANLPAFQPVEEAHAEQACPKLAGATISERGQCARLAGWNGAATNALADSPFSLVSIPWQAELELTHAIWFLRKASLVEHNQENEMLLFFCAHFVFNSNLLIGPHLAVRWSGA